MGDIFREIDEELRQERFEKLWSSYGRHFIVVGVLLVLAVVGWRVWDHYSTKQRQTWSLQFSTADRLVQEGKKEEAAALFASLAERASGGYERLSRFRQAALRGDSGDIAGAVSLYDALAADDGLAPRLRDAAVLFAVMLQVDSKEADLDALRARLDPLLSADNPWRHSAAELSGVLSLKAGDRDRARGRFKAIADDPQAPQSMRARAAQVLAVIGG